MTKTLALVVLAVLGLAAPAMAHVTVNVEPVNAPFVVGVPTNVTVRFSEPCLEMAIELATGNDELTAILDPAAPVYVTGAGQSTSWGIELCDPSDPAGRVDVGVPLALTVDATAPGLTNISVPVNYLNANGESGEAALLNVTIAYYANATLEVAAEDFTDHDAHGGDDANDDAHHDAPRAAKAIHLNVDYAINAPSLLTFAATASTGEVHEPDAVAVNPPSFANQSRGAAEATATFEPPANWTTADLSFTAYLTPTVGGPRIEVAKATLTLDNGQASGIDDGYIEATHAHDEEDKSIPSPTFAPLAMALVAVAALRRR